MFIISKEQEIIIFFLVRDSNHMHLGVMSFKSPLIGKSLSVFSFFMTFIGRPIIMLNNCHVFYSNTLVLNYKITRHINLIWTFMIKCISLISVNSYLSLGL